MAFHDAERDDSNDLYKDVYKPIKIKQWYSNLKQFLKTEKKVVAAIVWRKIFAIDFSSSDQRYL